MCPFPSLWCTANAGGAEMCNSLWEENPPDGHCESISNVITTSVYNRPHLSLSFDDDCFPVEKGTVDFSTKKLFHNANERHRRKKLNALYSKLRSLLPVHDNPKRKLSIPAIVCRVVKYIPQLRTQIRNLSQQRDELLALTKFSEEAVQADVSPNLSMQSRQIFPNVNIISAGGSHLLLTVFAYKDRLLFSTILLLLEEERLDVVDASTFIFDDKSCYNLHLKVLTEGGIFDTDALCSKLLFLCA